MANLLIKSDVANCDVKINVIHGEGRKVDGKDILMSDEGRPELAYKDPTGTEIVKWAEVDRNKVLISDPFKLVPDSKGVLKPEKGKNQVYVDKNGKMYDKAACQAFYQTDSGELIPATKNEATTVFEVRTWDTVENYLNKYQMDKYYQVSPSDGKQTKDHARALMVQANTEGMKKLFEHMHKNNVVGKGVLNITSAGFLPSVGYLRAIKLDAGKWTLEMAIFRETKPFTWSEGLDWKPTLTDAPKATKGKTAQVSDL